MTEDETKTDTKSIWLLLLKEGGYWTADEIATALEVDSSDWIYRVMHMMSRRGHIRRHERQGKFLSYSVDRTCKIPMYMRLDDLITAGVEV